MSSLPSPLPPPPPDAAPGAPARRPLVWLTGGLAVVVMATGSVVAVVGHDDPYPDAWDPRVLELVDFVEDERDLEFRHPVEIEFLTPEEYGARLRSDEAELTDADRLDIEESASLFRAFGLAEGELDLFESSNDI